jgi:hypothetical protein
VSETAVIMDALLKAARDPSIDIAKMQWLMETRTKINAEAAERTFNDAMASAQSEMRPVEADASNPQTRSKYASYAALDRALRPIYTRHGFALSFNSGTEAPENHIQVICDVTNGGHTRRYQLPVPADGKGAKGGDVMTKTHAVGSALSYGSRYLLKMIFNVAVGEADDDGNAAGKATISEEQVEKIQSLIMDANADLKRFMTYMKVAKIADIPATKFQSAVDALEAKRRASL